MSTKENSTVKKGLWNLIDRIEGDKVVWIIVFMLLMISWLAIFSSTPLLALEMHTDRISIMKEQMIITLLGLGVLLLFFSIRKVGFLHWFSQWGFLGSVLLLLILISKKDFGFIEVEVRNEAVRNRARYGYFDFVKAREPTVLVADNGGVVHVLIVRRVQRCCRGEGVPTILLGRLVIRTAMPV